MNEKAQSVDEKITSMEKIEKMYICNLYVNMTVNQIESL